MKAIEEYVDYVLHNGKTGIAKNLSCDWPSRSEEWECVLCIWESGTLEDQFAIKGIIETYRNGGRKAVRKLVETEVAIWKMKTSAG